MTEVWLAAVLAPVGRDTVPEMLLMFQVPDCVAGKVPPVPVTSQAVVLAVFPGWTVQVPDWAAWTAKVPPLETTHGEVDWVTGKVPPAPVTVQAPPWLAVTVPETGWVVDPVGSMRIGAPLVPTSVPAVPEVRVTPPECTPALV